MRLLFFNTLRNLLLAFVTFTTFMRWVLPKATYSEQLLTYQPRSVQPDQSMYLSGTINTTGAYLATEVIIINDWFFNLWFSTKGSMYYFFSTVFANRMEQIVQGIMILSYIWFATSHRKPPDKLDNWCTRTTHFLCNVIYIIDDIFYNVTGIQINTCLGAGVFYSILTNGIQTLLHHVISVEFPSQTSATTPKFWSQVQPLVYGSVQSCSLRHLAGQTLVSNVVLSCSAEAEQGRTHLDDMMQLDSDSYQIAIDTCTTFHLCKHKELFIDGIKPCTNIYIQGVGGRTRVQGYGSIKLRVHDDDGILHELIINEVLYVPNSPTNLLSPQRWSQCSKDPKGTGEITVNGTTILFWNGTKHSKVITHHPQLGIPIMSINDGYTKNAVLCSLCSDQPSIPAYLNTSTTVVDKAGNTHVIPVNDEEESFEHLPAPAIVTSKDEQDNTSVTTLEEEEDTTSTDPPFDATESNDTDSCTTK